MRCGDEGSDGGVKRACHWCRLQSGVRRSFSRRACPGSGCRALLHTISNRVTRLLELQGLLVRDPEHDYLDLDPREAFEQLIGASIQHRIAIGPNAGKKALTLHTVLAQPGPLASALLARQPGFSLHAATFCEAEQHDKLEKL